MAEYSNLLPVEWDHSKIEDWLQEDIPSFDYGGFVVGDKEEEATLYCKSDGVLCGSPLFEQIFKKLGCTVEWKEKEGKFLHIDRSDNKDRIPVAIVRGEARKILVGERTSLNILCRASGIATRSRMAAELAHKHGFKGKIAGTRKTTPGFRSVEKYAILVGGCDAHRMDLSSMIMLKDNHIWSSENITNAVKKAKEVGGFSLKIEVECRDINEAEEAIVAGADVIMLDNYSPKKLKEESKTIKFKYPHILLEASGGVTLDTLPEYFCDSIDIISMGALTQSVPHVDFSLKVKH